MIKRPDIELVNELVKNRRLAFSKGQHWLSLPLINVPPMPLDSKGEFDTDAPRTAWQEFYYQHRDADPLTVLQDELACPLFDEFVVQLFDDYYMHIRLAPNMVWGLEELTIADRKKVGTFTLTPGTTSNVLNITRYNDQPFKCDSSEPIAPTIGDNRKVGIAANDLAVRFICTTLLFLQYNHQSDKYAVEVKPAKRGLSFSKKSALASKQGPTIIYLDKFPTKHSSVATGEGGHKRAHPRRGHYKTLRAECFKDHPKYGVENGIYVRPAWIGERSTVIEGNIYTVRG